jgi:hypothetical protein
MNVRKVEVVPYENKWCELFQQEAKLLKEAMPENVKMHHIRQHLYSGTCCEAYYRHDYGSERY